MFAASIASSLSDLNRSSSCLEFRSCRPHPLLPGLDASLPRSSPVSPVPPSFRSAFSAVSTKRGDLVELNCEANGEKPMAIVWSKDRMQFDPRLESRYELSHTERDDGLSVDLKIAAVDRRDSALFTCTASNSYGRAEYNLQVIVQGESLEHRVSTCSVLFRPSQSLRPCLALFRSLFEFIALTRRGRAIHCARHSIARVSEASARRFFFVSLVRLSPTQLGYPLSPQG